MHPNTPLQTFLADLVGEHVKVTPHTGPRCIGRLTAVQGDPSDPVLVVDAHPNPRSHPVSEVERLQFGQTIPRK